jgi:hypothetical protein
VKRGSFGSNGLRVNGKVFAMTVRGALVVKLPRDRVAELIASGAGSAFESGGRVMKEWVTVVHGSWIALAREARCFVRGGADPAGRVVGAASATRLATSTKARRGASR